MIYIVLHIYLHAHSDTAHKINYQEIKCNLFILNKTLVSNSVRLRLSSYSLGCLVETVVTECVYNLL